MLTRPEINGFIAKYKDLEARGWPTGFKGQTWFSSSFVYAPYVPLIVTPVIYEPKNFTPRKGIMARYATKILSSSYYGTVNINTGPTFTCSDSIDKK